MFPLRFGQLLNTQISLEKFKFAQNTYFSLPKSAKVLPIGCLQNAQISLALKQMHICGKFERSLKKK